MSSASPHGIPLSSFTQALRALYGTASALGDFMDSHIEALKASGDETKSRTGEILAAAKFGFLFGYATPIAIVGVGQLLLGNPLTALVSMAGMAVNPFAITCAAVGAIWMGWKALAPAEQARILETVKTGLGLAISVVAAIIEFVIKQAQTFFAKPQVNALREMVRDEASAFGKSLAQVTGGAVDAVLEYLPRKPATPQGNDEALTQALGNMNRSELTAMLHGTFGHKRKLDDLELPQMRRLVEQAFADAACYSVPWASPPSYPQTVALVAARLNLPSSTKVHVRELERTILFKVVELSLGKLDEKQQANLANHVSGELRSRGVEKRVTFQEIAAFVKTGGVDIGGTLGGLVLAAPGIYGIAGLNFLQFVVLKGIVLSSGYFAGGAALMGFGTGGLVLAVAGWAGPVGAGLALLYTAHRIAGPAHRKLIPAVCMLAAKRLELEAGELPAEAAV